jgi:hypothetical protein
MIVVGRLRSGLRQAPLHCGRRWRGANEGHKVVALIAEHFLMRCGENRRSTAVEGTL